MSDQPSGVKSSGIQNRRVHMANERTFLAWIRTSIGIMAFGFVVEKFAFFIKQMGRFLQRTAGGQPAVALPDPSSSGYSSLFGIVLIGLGALMGLLAFIRYKKVERQIENDTYQTSLLLDVLLTLSVTVIGIFLLIYLSHTFA